MFQKIVLAKKKVGQYIQLGELIPTITEVNTNWHISKEQVEN